MSRAPRICCLLALLVAARVGAQGVRGTIVERDGATAVPGVVVVLSDSAGNTVGRVLTDDRGEFALRTPSSGKYRLRALRIGYEPTESDILELTPSATRETRLMLTGAPIRLRAIRITERSTCERHDETTASVLGAWEEARKALLAASLTGADRRYQVQIATFDRWLGRRGQFERQVLKERTGSSVNPFVSASVQVLRDEGYVVADPFGVTYRGPDASVLASETFAQSYCLRFARDSSSRPGVDRDLLGLAFTPARARRKGSDIEGTLWLDRESAELRALDFRYTGLAKPAAEHARGRAEFLRLPTGGWMVKRFAIYMPMLGAERGKEQRLFLIGIQVAGGELLVVRRSSAAVYQGGITLVGSVRDREGRPASGARITVEGIDRAARADSAGQFTFPMLPEGPHLVRLHTALLDSLGTPPIEMPVELSARTPSLSLIAPRALDALNAICRDIPADRWGHRSLVHGRVIDEKGASLAGAQVQLVWHESAVQGHQVYNRPFTEEATSGADGTYRLCNIPRDTPLKISVRLQGTELWTSAASINISVNVMFVRQDLTFRR
jgi:hypothetical protein